MNSRERMIRAIEMTGPDRVPVTHATLPGAEARYGQKLQDLYARYPSDVYLTELQTGGMSTGEYGPEIGVPSRDAWGAWWVRTTDEHKGQVVHCPLRDWEALPGYEPPDAASEGAMAEIEREIAQNDGRLYFLTDGDTLWQRMFYLHGYQETLQDLLLRPDRCADLRDMILGVMLRRVQRLCLLPGLDGLHFRDDWGTQTALMISPGLWRSFFKPAYARLFAPVRDAGKHVWFHSDGFIEEIIPDLLEIGVQVFNPQVPAMGRQRVAELCAGRVCILGDLDRQGTMPYGTPEEVRAEVRADIDAFGRYNGGYIGRGEVAGDVPLENVVAMMEELASCGAYAHSPAQRIREA